MSDDKQLAYIIGGCLVSLCIFATAMACSTVAKTQYGAQLDGCIDNAKNRAEADACLAQIRLMWDEAGARAPALVVSDGGAQ